LEVSVLGLDASDAEEMAAKEARKRGKRDFSRILGTETSSRFENYENIYTVQGRVEGEIEEGRILKKQTPVIREFEAQIDAKKGILRGFKWKDEDD
jgi:hypothetical protein